MPRPTIYFFADDDDIVALFSLFEKLGDFKYVEPVSDVNKPLQEYLSAAEAQEGFFASKFIADKRKGFFVLDLATEVCKREIALADGTGIKERMDMYTNPDSIGLGFGGEIPDSTIVMSTISTIGDTERARDKLRLFRNLVMRNTVRVGEKGSPSRLMPGAVGKLKDGWRLTRSGSSPTKYDPRISAEELATL